MINIVVCGLRFVPEAKAILTEGVGGAGRRKRGLPGFVRVAHALAVHAHAQELTIGRGVGRDLILGLAGSAWRAEHLSVAVDSMRLSARFRVLQVVR